MQEKIFRGKQKDTGEWIEGDLFNNYDKRKFIGDLIINDYVGTACDRYVLEIDFDEVIPDTVGQFINDYDRNNKKIFEGDIVDIFYNNGKYAGTGVVVGTDYVVENGLGYRRPIGCGRCEIIGNIYDNPELIDGLTERWLDGYYFNKQE